MRKEKSPQRKKREIVRTKEENLVNRGPAPLFELIFIFRIVNFFLDRVYFGYIYFTYRVFTFIFIYRAYTYVYIYIYYYIYRTRARVRLRLLLSLLVTYLLIILYILQLRRRDPPVFEYF